MARRGRGAATRTDTPDGIDGAMNGSLDDVVDDLDQPGARTMGAIAVQRWAARGPGTRSEGTDVGDRPMTRGPFDDEDLDPARMSAELVDFGAVRIPVPRGGQVAVEPEEGRLQAVHVMLPAGRLSVSALAAPRNGRLWPDLAAEIDESLREGGATVRSFTGEWGRELHARTGDASSVFVGVDGPRWMLYGVATGPTSTAKELDAALRRMLHATVVARGRLPYPVRTVLPLVVPEQFAAEEAAAPGRVPAARGAEESREQPSNGRRAGGPNGLRAPAGTGRPAEPSAPLMGRPGPLRGPASVPPPAVPPPPVLPPSRAVERVGVNGHDAMSDVPTEPHGVPRVTPGPAGDGRAVWAGPSRTAGPAPRAGHDVRNGASVDDGATRFLNGAATRPAAPAPVDPPVSSTGQRRVAELLAEAERDRAAREAAAARAARTGRPDAAGRGAVPHPDAAPSAPRPPEYRAPEYRPSASWPPEQQPPASPPPWASAPAAFAGPPPAPDRPADPLADPLRSALPPSDDRSDGYGDVALLRLGGAPRRRDEVPAEPADPGWSVAASETVRAPAARPEPVGTRPSDGSDDWTVPMAVVPPAPEPQDDGRAADPRADAPWVAEARRAAREARAAEERGRPGRHGGDGHRAPDPAGAGGGRSRAAHERAAHERAAHDRTELGAYERAAHERGAHERAAYERSAHDRAVADERAAHRRGAHERPGRAAPGSERADLPPTRVAPPVRPAPVADPWPPLDDRRPPLDDPAEGRHRRPER